MNRSEAGTRVLACILVARVMLPQSAAAFDDGSTFIETRGSTGTITGSSLGSARVTEHGAATYVVPIEIPPGTAGMRPELALVYSSEDRRDSWIGLGWDLPLGTISRSLHEGVPSYDDTDVFVLDGERLVADGAIPDRFHTRYESFKRIDRIADGPDHIWEVRLPDGEVRRYGTSDASRVKNDAGETFSWHLTEVEDLHGNAYQITYDDRDPGVLYPKEIRYTLRRSGASLVSMNGALPPQPTVDRVVVLNLETRQDETASFAAGFLRHIAHRLDSISVSVAGFPYRTYDLYHGSLSLDSYRSLVREVRETGAGPSPGAPRVTSFAYRSNVDDGTRGWTFVGDGRWENGPPFVNYVFGNRSDAGARIGDVDGDGRDDIVRAMRDESNPLQNDAESGVYLNNGSGFDALGWTLPQLGFDGSGGDATFTALDKEYGMILADLDRDGRADLLVSRELLLNIENDELERRHRFEPFRNDADPSAATPWTFASSNPDTVTSVVLEEGPPPGFTNFEPIHSFAIWTWNGGGFVVAGGRAMLGDLDGDGRPDLLSHSKERIRKLLATVMLEGRDGYTNHYSLQDPDMQFGVPQSDRFQVCDGQIASCVSGRLATSRAINWDVGLDFVAVSEFDRFGKRLVDVNADGLADWVAHDPAIDEVQINTGVDFQAPGDWPSSAWNVPTKLDNGFNDQGVRFVDVNGDGRIDLLKGKVELGGVRAWINSGSPALPWIETPEWEVPTGPLAAPDMEFISPSGYDRGVRIADLDGDGMPDLIRAEGGGLFPQHVVYLNKGSVPDLLETVTTWRGGTIDFTYTPSTEFSHMENGRHTLPLVMQLVSEMRVDAGDGSPQVTTYGYSGGKFDPVENEFLAFRAITETRVGDGREIVRTYHQSAPLAGMLESEAVGDGTDLWRETHLTYTQDPTAPFVRLVEATEVDEFDGIAGEPRRIRTEFIYDEGGAITLGNLTGIVELGAVDASGIDLVPSDTRSTQLAYRLLANPLVDLPYLTDRVEAMRVRAGADPTSGTVAEEMLLGYDESSTQTLADVVSVVGVLDLGMGTGPTTILGYDEYGNLESVTSPRAAAGEYSGATVIDYDLVLHAFPIAVTNPLGHRTEIGYLADAGCSVAYPVGAGLVHDVADPNALAESESWIGCHDPYGRPVLLRGPGDLAETTWVYDDTPTAVSSTRSERVDAQGGVRLTTVHLDGIGRVASIARSAAGGQVSTESLEYDGAGRLEAAVAPHVAGVESERRTTLGYDPLDRAISISLPGTGRVTTLARDRGVVTRKDPNLNERVLTHDAFGRLTLAVEDGGALATSYEYDLLGRLTGVVDPHLNRTEIGYDSLGRKTIQRDPDIGEIAYDEYDPEGNLKAVTTPRGQVTWSYDALNRVTQRKTPGEQQASWQYDTATRGIGRVASHVRFPFVTTTTEYDLLGRVLRSEHTTATEEEPHVFLNAYNDLGELLSRVYPNGGVVDRVYDSAGFPTEIDDGAGNPYASALMWDGSGHLTAWTAGNGISNEIEFDAVTGRLHEIRVGGGSLEHLRYGYDDGDRITSILNPSEPQWDRPILQYDALDRLTQAQGPFGPSGAQATLHYVYDEIGNLTCLAGSDPSTCAGGTQFQLPGPAATPTLYRKPHLPTQATIGGVPGAVTHDVGGNLESIAGRTHTYDLLGDLQTTSDASGLLATFAYDGHELKVVEDAVTGNRIQILAPDFEWNSTAATGVVRVQLAGVVLATHESAYDPVTNGCANVSPAWPRGLGDSALGLLAPGLAALALLILAGGLRRRPQPVWRIAVAGSTAGTFFVVFVVPLPALLVGAEAARAVSPSGVTYYHGDHQGSPVVVSDDAGNEVGRFVYRPFGEAIAIAGGGAPAIGFTNQRRIAAAGLHDYRARIYDPRVGRFLQPDPLVSSRRSPSQALDRYSYVGNDPVDRIDPTGMGSIRELGPPAGGNLPSPFSDPTAFPLGLPSTQPSAFGIAVLEFQRVTNEVPPTDSGVVAQAPAGPTQPAGDHGFITPERIEQLHTLAKEANASASVIIGGGVPVAGFGAVTVDVDGNVSLDLGLGVGAGELSTISVVVQGEVRGGELGLVRLDFMAGGAIVGGAMQRASVSLTSPGAAAGAGFLGGQGGFIFMGPTVSIPLGNVADFGR